MDFKNVSDEDLEEELERRKQVREEMKKILVPLENPDFSYLCKYIVHGIEEAVREGFPPKDFKHYIYEAAMEAVYGKDFWKWRNKQKW